MPTYVGGGCQHISSDVSLIRKCTTQNVRSATMAEPLATVAAHIIGRMILVCALVLGYCLSGCLGVPYRPAVFSKTLDTAGSLDLIAQIFDNAVDTDRFAPSEVFHLGKDIEADSRLDDRSSRLGPTNQDRKSSLKQLLENLTKLQQRHATDGPDLGTAVHTDENDDTREKDTADKLWVNTFYPQKHYQLQPEPYFRSSSDTHLDLNPLQVIAQLDMTASLPDDDQGQLAYDQAQPVLTDQRTQTHNQASNRNLFSTFEVPVTIEESGTREINNYLDSGDVNKRKSEQTIEDRNKEIDRANLDNLAIFLDKEKYPARYFTVPDSMLTTDFEGDAFDTTDTRYRDRQIGYNDNSFDGAIALKDIPHESVDIATEANWVGRDFHKVISADTIGADTGQPSEALSVESLIHKTVKKMEGIIKKRVAHYNDVFDTDSAQELPGRIVRTHRNMDTDYDRSNMAPAYITTSLEEAGAASFVIGHKDVAENEDTEYSDGLFSQKQQHSGQVNDVTAAVIKAVTSRTVPRDAQFWRNVSSYLDSSDYLSRTRRSPNRSRKRKGPQYVHLSITYGHVMPCEYKDRFYCMNGGTCVFVGALDIKTCRCPIGYTGIRCEMIDQEYILSLLTNTLIFS